MSSVIESSVVGMASTARLIQMPLRRSMLRPNSATTMPAIAMPNVLALTAKPIVARLTPNLSTSDGRIACAANRSTSVRKAISAMMPKRMLSAATMRSVCRRRLLKAGHCCSPGTDSTFPACPVRERR